MSNVYKVWKVDGGDDRDSAKKFTGIDHEDAAENWAKWYDSYYADYLIVGGDDAQVFVLHEGEDEPVLVTVSGESEPVYHASVEQ